MKTLDTNDWLVLNSIIYKIYTTEDEKEMRTLFLEQLKMLIDFDAADFYLAADNSESGLVDPVAYNCDCVSGEYDELDYSRGILYSGKSMVYRETDIIDDEKRKASEYYQKVYRSIGKDNFEYDDIFLVDMLRDHLAFRLSRESVDQYEPGSRRIALIQKSGATDRSHRFNYERTSYFRIMMPLAMRRGFLKEKATQLCRGKP